MAIVSKINGKADGPQALAWTTLTAADTFTFNAGVNTLVIFNNDTAGSLTAVVKGASATSKTVEGIGPVTLSAGVSVTVGAASVQRLYLQSRKELMVGASVSITGAAGLKVAIIEL